MPLEFVCIDLHLIHPLFLLRLNHFVVHERLSKSRIELLLLNHLKLVLLEAVQVDFHLVQVAAQHFKQNVDILELVPGVRPADLLHALFCANIYWNRV